MASLVSGKRSLESAVIYLAAFGDGVCNSKLPLGRSVAVVSRLRASKPCPSSVSMNCDLKQVNKMKISRK